MASKQILSEFKKNIILFLDALAEQVPELTTQFMFGHYVIGTQYTEEVLMNSFIQHILPHEDEIKSRNDNFFFEHAQNLVGGGNVNYFRMLWNSSRLDDEDRSDIWNWFDTFLFLCKKYQKSLAPTKN